MEATCSSVFVNNSTVFVRNILSQFNPNDLSNMKGLKMECEESLAHFICSKLYRSRLKNRNFSIENFIFQKCAFELLLLA